MAKAGKKDEGLDEARRVTLMAQFRRQTEKYELGATLTNALVFHHGRGALDEVSKHVLAVLEGGEGEDAGRAFLWEQIDWINKELGQ